jgi:hypothetical protein
VWYCWRSLSTLLILPAKFAKIKLRQDALQSIFSGRLDIFYPQISAIWDEGEFFNISNDVDHVKGRGLVFFVCGHTYHVSAGALVPFEKITTLLLRKLMSNLMARPVFFISVVA